MTLEDVWELVLTSPARRALAEGRGDRDASTTLRQYCSALPQEDLEAADFLEALYDGATGDDPAGGSGVALPSSQAALQWGI